MFIEISGPPNTFKTHAALGMLLAASAAGHKCLYIGTEKVQVDRHLQNSFGGALKTFDAMYINDGDVILEQVKRASTEGYLMVVIDPVSAVYFPNCHMPMTRGELFMAELKSFEEMRVVVVKNVRR